MFNFNSDFDADTFKTLTSLIKSNNGQFKTVKQASFLSKRLKIDRAEIDTKEGVLKYFGIDMNPELGQYICMIEGSIRWVDYGHNSYRPVTWVFLMDQHGVVAQYKLGYVGTMREGTCPDPTKTKNLWTRQGEVVPLIVEEKTEENLSDHIGKVGERMMFKGTIKFVNTFDRPKFSYYDSGVGHITTILVDNSEVVYFGFLGEKDTEVNFKATIKEHSVYKDRKQTIVARPKVL